MESSLVLHTKPVLAVLWQHSLSIIHSNSPVVPYLRPDRSLDGYLTLADSFD
jgi:hypothetical protein